MPQGPTLDPTLYRRCTRCGIDIKPTPTRRQCRDCYELEVTAQKDALLDEVETLWRAGMTQRQMAKQLGVHHSTIANWVTDLRAMFPDVEFVQSLREYPAWVREIHVDAHRLLHELEAV